MSRSREQIMDDLETRIRGRCEALKNSQRCDGKCYPICNKCLGDIIKQRDDAIKLLRDCYIAGHRNGWEDGPTNQEVFDRVAMFMHFHDSEWWKQQQWESEGE